MNDTIFRLFESTGLVGGLWFLLSKAHTEVQSMRFRRQLKAVASQNVAGGNPAAGGTDRRPYMPPLSAAHETKCIHCGRAAPMFIGGHPCTDAREAAAGRGREPLP